MHLLSVILAASHSAQSLNPTELLLNNALAGSILAITLIWRTVVTHKEMNERLAAKELEKVEAVAAERRISAIHEEAAKAERAGRLVAEKALEGSTEAQALMLSVLTAIRSAKDGGSSG